MQMYVANLSFINMSMFYIICEYFILYENVFYIKYANVLHMSMSFICQCFICTNVLQMSILYIRQCLTLRQRFMSIMTLCQCFIYVNVFICQCFAYVNVLYIFNV